MKKLVTALLLAVLVCPVFAQLTSWTLPVGVNIIGSNMVTYQDALYFVADIGPRDGARLCKFDGVTFTVLPSPSPTLEIVSHKSPLQVFQGNLYMIATDWPDEEIIPPAPALYRYDGTSFTRIPLPFTQIPSTFAFSDMEVYHDKLYIDVAPDELSPVNAWVTFDGTSFALVNYPPGMLDEGRAGMIVYHDQLFRLMEATRGGAPVLMSYDGTSFHTHAIADLMRTQMGIYQDKLILTQSVGTSRLLVAYDGTAASGIATPPDAVLIPSGKEVYGGLLYMHMANAATPPGGNVLMAYDGSTFSRIVTPSNAIEDYEVWRGALYFGAGSKLFAYHPLALGSFFDFDRIDIDLFAPERGWCWNEIVIDWDIHPICLTPPLCPPYGEYPIDLSFLDKDKIVWETIVKKPSTLPIPVSDNPYTFSLASAKTKTPENLLTVDKTLVSLGIETIKLGFHPYDKKVNVTLATQEGKQVPVTLSFLNKDNVPVWQETVTAPAEKQFEVKTPVPGTKWLITPAGKSLEAAGITATEYYPNPFSGKITVKVETKGDKVPVQITIDNMSGTRVVTSKLTAPAEQTIELKDNKPGFYVLTISAGGASKKALIELKE